MVAHHVNSKGRELSIFNKTTDPESAQSTGKPAANGTISWNLSLAVKPGQLETFRTLMMEMVAHTKKESGTVAYEWFVSDDGKAVDIYERYDDSAAALVHLGGFGEQFAERFMGAVDPTGLSVYGNPSTALRDGLEAFGAQYLAPFGGFAR